MTMISMTDFEKIDIRVGRILKVDDFPQARKPAYQLTIDLGSEIGIKKSSAQIVDNYTKEDLVNKLVLCLINAGTKQIGPFISEVLTLGVPGADHTVILITPDKPVELGGKLY